MLQLLDHADIVRKEMGGRINPRHKAEYGQFMTPSTVARFMTSLFPRSTMRTARLLDAGAGLGSLSGAFLDRVAAKGFSFQQVEVAAFEIDSRLRDHLSQTLGKYHGEIDLDASILAGDFIEEAVKRILGGDRRFTHAILNPPYKKIHSASPHRLLLREVGIETVNLYSAFVALAVELMRPGGEIVAIIPRSFCNGPYYRPFRELLLARTAIRRLHLFATRDRTFKDDSVLQENIIVALVRDGRQGDVTVSTSTDDTFADMETHAYSFDRIISHEDPEHFIHVPTSPEQNAIELSPLVRHSLADIGIEVSTGPVVDFRLKAHLRPMPERGTVPLLYPVHFSGARLEWPRPGNKKPNAILRNGETERWLFPNGCYVVVRRFSSKEEKRRVVANVIPPGIFDTQMLGFENHLNVFHSGRQGIPESLAHGLAVFLNSTAVDDQFRAFSGHTQVNATDLRFLKYPGRETLIRIGDWASAQNELTQNRIDRKIESTLCRKTTR